MHFIPPRSVYFWFKVTLILIQVLYLTKPKLPFISGLVRFSLTKLGKKSNSLVTYVELREHTDLAQGQGQGSNY